MLNFNDFFKSENEKNKTILFIDYYNLVHRTIFVAAYKAQKDGLTTSEMYSYFKYLVINNLFNSVKNYTPNRVVIAIDDTRNWRKRIFPAYKENRKALRDNNVAVDFKEFYPILEKFTEELKVALPNFVFIKVERAEADDIIATLVKKEKENFKECIIVTTDGDYVQLLQYENVKIFNPQTKTWVKSLNPLIEMDIKIISGDKGDNIPNLRAGIGKGRAAKIIKSGVQDFLLENKLERVYRRNKILVDWNFIPRSITKKILNKYDEYIFGTLNCTKLLMFLASTKNEYLATQYSVFSKYLSKVA